MDAKSLAELPKSDLVHKLQRVAALGKRANERARHAGSVVMGTIITVAGGGAGAAAHHFMPKLWGTDIDSDLAAGFVAVGVAAMGTGTALDEQIGDFGAGCLAFVAGRSMSSWLASRDAAEAGTPAPAP